LPVEIIRLIVVETNVSCGPFLCLEPRFEWPDAKLGDGAQDPALNPRMRPSAIIANGRHEISFDGELAAHKRHRERISIEGQHSFEMRVGCNENLELRRSIPITIETAVRVFNSEGRFLRRTCFGHTLGNVNPNGRIFHFFRTDAPTAFVDVYECAPPKLNFSCRSHLPREGQLKANSNTCCLASCDPSF
jgi:hypothetical protein